MAKYFIIAGLVVNGISILMDVFITGFSEITYYKLICCGWMFGNLAAVSKIEDLESDNEILSDHIKDIINTVKGYKK
jgi:hypothetical protein